MTTTNLQLYTLVGEELGIVQGNEALSADDTDKISRRATRVRAWLLDEGLVYWLDDAIPDAAALPVAKILASQCAEVFGRGPTAESPYADGPAGLQLLKEHVSQRSAKEPVKAEYF